MTEAYVYVIRYEAKLHKVGVTMSPKDRLKSLRSHFWRDLEIIKTWLLDPSDVYRVETEARHALEHYLDRSHPPSRERFTVTAECACLAVELAIKLVVDQPEVPLPAMVPPLSVFEKMPIHPHRRGFVRLGKNDDRRVIVAAMRAQGVDPDLIYIHEPWRRACRMEHEFVRALRPGLEAFVIRRDDLTPEMLSGLAEKDVPVLEAPWPPL